MRHILTRALQVEAAGFLLVHNHPSGNPRPSAADRAVTARLRIVAAELRIPLLDHLIIAGDAVRSIVWDLDESSQL